MQNYRFNRYCISPLCLLLSLHKWHLNCKRRKEMGKGKEAQSTSLFRRVPFCRRSVKLPARERERSRRPASFHFQPCCERLRGPITARHYSRNLYHRDEDPRAVPVSPVPVRASDKLEFDYQRSNEADVERWKGGRANMREWQIRKCVVRSSVVQQRSVICLA